MTPLSRSTSRRTASSPIVWIDWSIVVNGGSVSADSGMLSKPITDTSSGTDSPSERATFIVWIAERSLAAKIAVGGSASSSSWRAGSTRRLELVPADANEVGVEVDAGGGEGVVVALLAQPRRLEVGTTAEEADPSVTEADEVLGRGDRSGEVVGVDVGHRRGAGVRVDGDDQPGLADVVDGRGDEDDPVGQRAAQPRHVAALPAGVVEAVAAAGVDDQLVARRLDRPGRALEQLGAERLDVGDEDPDHVGAVAAQAAGDQARLVAELADHRLDPASPSRRRRRSGR